MKVARFECSSSERLSALMGGDPGVPYRAHRTRIGSPRFDRWASERAARLLCESTGAFEVPTGAIGWKALDWDSRMFGFPAARIELPEPGIDGGINSARKLPGGTTGTVPLFAAPK